MALSPKIELRATQSLVMTPQLMQAIKLLQLSNLDLTAYVEAELERNPLLEREDEASDSSGDGNERGAGEAGDDRRGGAEVGESERDGERAADDRTGDRDEADNIGGADSVSDVLDEGAAASADLDADLAEVYPDDPLLVADPGGLAGDPWMSAGGRGPLSGEDYDLEAFAASDVSLRDYLAEQLVVATADPVRRLIGHFLIDSLDEAGYLRIDLETVAERLDAPLSEVEAGLAIVQGFDPVGIAARDLAECLALQLAAKDRFDPAMRAMIANLPLLARRDFPALKRVCGVEEDDLVDMIAEVRALDPKPGNAFGSSVLQPVVPDVFVRPDNSGGWRVDLNAETLPRVLLSRTYSTTVSGRVADPETKAYLNECMQTANWLIKSLDQRARTILKVATEIVRQQDAFLLYGVRHLRPLNLRTVAEAIGMHESTVSRVTSNKYMATTRGVFELKYFFTAAIASSEGGDAHSAEAVRHRIRQLIDAEKPDAILSDDTIVAMLKESGIDIARRTVAKYREAMRIPSSVQRRREKRSLTGA